LNQKKEKGADFISQTELFDALKEAHEQIEDLKNIIAELEWLEEALRRRTSELSERVKELDCLYTVSSRLINSTDSLQKILADIVNVMPLGWQYPKFTCVRLVLNSHDYRTSNFCKTKLKQSAFIRQGNKRIGVLEVYQLPFPRHDKFQPFLPQEKQLLDVIAMWISVIIKYRS
jgi:nitrate/nitrite-specific signal transduction histidine kinase